MIRPKDQMSKNTVAVAGEPLRSHVARRPHKCLAHAGGAVQLRRDAEVGIFTAPLLLSMTFAGRVAVDLVVLPMQVVQTVE